jgi:5-methylcytosine-specific restriction enzyme subunit McrC
MEPSTGSSAPPAVPIRNLWYLFLYAWDMARFRDRWAAEAEAAPSLPALLARVLAEITRERMRRGLSRSYGPARRTVRGLRGRIDFAQTLKHLALADGRTHCRYEELDIDDLRNRILRATLHRLAKDPRLADDKAAETKALRRELTDLLSRLEGVALVEPTAALFNRLPTGRTAGPDRLAMNLCRLVHRLEMPSDRPGPTALPALLHEEILHHRLFERFVLNFYRLHLRDRFQASSEMLAWPDAFGCRFVPAMRTDITLRSRRPPPRRIVIETKFSAAALAASPFGEEAFKPANLYQLYAYLRSQEEASEAHRTASGILLYPAVDLHLDEHMLVQGHRIRVATVDLGAPWPAIEKRLLDIALDWPEAVAKTAPIRPDARGPLRRPPRRPRPARSDAPEASRPRR